MVMPALCFEGLGHSLYGKLEAFQTEGMTWVKAWSLKQCECGDVARAQDEVQWQNADSSAGSSRDQIRQGPGRRGGGRSGPRVVGECPPTVHGHLEPQNATFVGNRSLQVQLVTKRSYWVRVGLKPKTGIPMRRPCVGARVAATPKKAPPPEPLAELPGPRLEP